MGGQLKWVDCGGFKQPAHDCSSGSTQLGSPTRLKTYTCPPAPPTCRPGETPWVKQVIAEHHEEAAQKGLRIVPCCGFDSTPFDLGALLVRGLVEWWSGRVGEPGGCRRTGRTCRGTAQGLLCAACKDNLPGCSTSHHK